jgi:hypothetical protein
MNHPLGFLVETMHNNAYRLAPVYKQKYKYCIMLHVVNGPEHYFHTAPLWIGLCWGQTRISRQRGAPSSRYYPKAMPYKDNAQRSDRIDARHCETLGGGARLHGQVQTCLYRAVKPPTALAIKANMRDLS